MVDLGGMGLTLPHDGLGGRMPVGTLSGEAAQLQMEPRIQQIIDVPVVVIKGVGADIAPLYKAVTVILSKGISSSISQRPA